MSFTISEISRTGTEVLYGLYLDPAADPGADGLESFEFDMLFETPDLTWVLGSATINSAFTQVPVNEDDAATGSVRIASFAFPSWTSFSEPLVTFKFDIASADFSETITLDNLFLDGISQTDVDLTFWTDNSDPTGSVTISGTVAEDQTLTASNNLADADGLGAITYTWYVSGSGTPVGTGTTYVPTQAEIGKTVTVIASYTDGDGKPESKSSAPTSAVVNTNDAPVDFIVTISGTEQEDSELTASASVTSDEDGLPTLPAGFSYQWQSSDNGTTGWTNISGATSSTFTPGDNEAGRFVRVVASYEDLMGTVENANSAASSIANVNDTPVGFSTSITGTVAEDVELTAIANVTSDDDGLPALPAGFSYQWQVSDNGTTGWVDIVGATNSTFTPGAGQVGKFLWVITSYTDLQGETESTTSDATIAVNDAPDGSVTITGIAAEDQMLTASDNLTDTDGVGTITYTWYASGSGTPIGTGPNFTLTQAEVDKTITVVASYTDGAGKSESVSSTATTTVTNVNDVPVDFLVSVSGTAAEDSELTASASVTSDEDGLPDPLNFSYQWQSSSDGTNWFDIDGATDTTFTPGDDEVGKFIRATASYTDEQGTLESTNSTATAAVSNVNDLPSGTVTITGTAAENEVLSAANTLSDDDGLGAITYTWFASGSGTPLGTGVNYTLTQAEVGKTITVVASYTDGNGTEESFSSGPTAQVTNENNAPVGFLVSISGTAEENSELTASASVISDGDGLPDPLVFSYQWQTSSDGTNWADIAGATDSTFTPNDAEVGKFIRVKASYTDELGTVENTNSAATAAVNNVNDAPSGSVIITGTVAEDQTLSVADTLTDDDGLGVITYTWFASGSGTPLGTGANYTLTQAEVGQTITVVASYTDGQGTPESVASASTSVVVNENDNPVGFMINISGTAQEDTELTANASVTSDEDGLPDPLVFSHQWQSSNNGIDWTDIAGATDSTFTPDQAQVGQFVRVVSSYVDDQGTQESISSAATASVANVNNAPTNFSVDITGTKSQGQTLTAAVGAVEDEDGTGALVYQWQRSNDVAGFDDIAGATAAAYTLVGDDVGKQMRLKVSYVDGQGTTEMMTSAPTSLVTNTNDAPAGLPVLTGTFAEGETVSVDLSGISDADGLPAPEQFSYQWQRSTDNGVNWSPIANATEMDLTLTASDSSNQVRVIVSFTDNGGTEESLASAGEEVTNVNNGPGGEVTISGDPAEDQTLTASNTLTDDDGLGAITYTWFASGSGTAIGTGSEYTLTQAEVGKTITVVASYTDGQGTDETSSSAPTSEVSNVNDAPTGAVTIAGTSAVGRTLTAANSLADEDGLGAITYTWFASGSATPLATGINYVLTLAEFGKTVTVVANYTDGQGTSESVSSAESEEVINLNNAATGTVIIIGDATVASELTAFNNLADVDGLGSISYQWYAAGVAIGGATGSVYEPILADKGKAITVVASYTDGQGFPEMISSAATAPVSDPGDLIEGTPGPDTLTGGDKDDTVVGFEGRDILRGNGGDDVLRGDEDIDTVVYGGDLVDFSLVRTNNEIEVSGPATEGNDLLIDIERLQFDDLNLAFDLDGNAGQVAKLLGIMLGKDDWYVREFVGIGLDFLDNSNITYEALMDIALDEVMAINGESRTNQSVFTLIYQNVVGSAPSQGEINQYVGLLENGTYTQASLAVAAAEYFLNLENIGLVGLIETGLEFT